VWDRFLKDRFLNLNLCLTFSGAEDMFQQHWHGADLIPASDKGDVLAALVEA